MKQKFHRDTWFLLFATLTFPAVAYAYIDPGFGALVLQAAAAAVLGAIFFLRSTIAAFFRKLTGRKAAPQVPPAPSEKPTEPG